MSNSRLPLALIAACAFALCCLIIPTSANANVNCSVTYNPANFGAGNATTSTIDYSCTNFAATPVSFTICAQRGTPSFPGTTSQPRMSGPFGIPLNFNLYTDAARTTVWVGTTYITKPIGIAANGTTSSSITYYGLIDFRPNRPAGTYSGAFFSTILGILDGGTCQSNSNSTDPEFSGASGNIDVEAIIGNNCTVNASNLSLGTVTANATAISGSTTINVSCPIGTAYYIGLAPSNGDLNGAGVLSGTGGNSSQVPYQLRSGSSSGPAWGNTATSSSVGNGVAGIGSGTAQSFNAFATVPSANYAPDDYSDTVTINVNF